MTEEQALDAMRRLLAELPAEFSDGPPEVYWKDREEFRVIKQRNVRAVHNALWELQLYFNMPQCAEWLED